MIPATATRVQEHTAPAINARIAHETERNIAAFQAGDKRVLIERRLAELDREWDVERVLQTNFALFSLAGLAGLASSARVDKRWLALALGVPAFMVQHALQGWCPPLAVLRRLGLRTAKEINDERFALKSMRGDFVRAGASRDVDEVFRAVTR